MEKLHRYKKEIDAFLASFLASKQKEYGRINRWGPDAIEKIRAIVSEGKTIRGSLILLSYSFFKSKISKKAIRVAAAMELLHTALLIHDDIMDHDEVRRGLPALHIQYKSEALAMCVGDILFFLAHELLSNTDVQVVTDQVFQEVCIAQMEDVAKSAKTKKDVLSLYTYKTARYTFSLPLMAGARLARADKKTIAVLEKLGEAMGILFQIRDDELDKETSGLELEKPRYQKNAMKLIHSLQINASDKKTLSDILDFVIHRER